MEDNADRVVLVAVGMLLSVVDFETGVEVDRGQDDLCVDSALAVSTLPFEVDLVQPPVLAYSLVLVGDRV